MIPPKTCPNCNTPWEEKETIYDHFRGKGYSKEAAAESAESYGCTKGNPKHFGKDVMGIETDNYDGVSYWACQKCEATFDRWTMAVLHSPKLNIIV